MTTKLYRLDAYQTQFEAQIVETRRRKADQLEVRLDQTAFYPTAGGQAFDTGALHGLEAPLLEVLQLEVLQLQAPHVSAQVLEVIEDDDHHIWHVLSEAGFKVGSHVMGSINWDRRFDHMQQHTGEHILGQAFFRLSKHVIAVNMESKVCTLDLDADVDWETAMQAERIANQAIWAGHPITTYEVPDTEIDRVPLRRTPKVSGLIRVVQIGDYDYSACGGTHTRTSSEVGFLKIFKLERIKGGATRVYFNSGHRLLDDYRFKHDFVSALGLRFSSSIESVPARTVTSLEELTAAKKEITALRAKLAQSIASSHPEPVVMLQLEDAAMLTELAKAFSAKPGQIALLGAIDDARAMICVACGEGIGAKAGDVLRVGLPMIEGRGGGKPDMAQGSGVKLEGLSAALEAMRSSL
jgi:alanyl-tRNA synthetase